MYWSEKFCFCFRLDRGCLLIAGISLIVSLAINAASIFYSVVDGNEIVRSYHVMNHILGAIHLDVDHRFKELIFGIILFLSILSDLSSITLILGVKLRLPGCVLSYFAYGIFITFFGFLSSLLLLLHGVWDTALIISVFLMIYIYFLTAVYALYEYMSQGKIFTSNSAADDDVMLIQP